MTSQLPRVARDSDLVERLIIVRRDRWGEIIKLTDELKRERSVSADPSEIAAIILEAGLEATRESLARLAEGKRSILDKRTSKATRNALLIVRGLLLTLADDAFKAHALSSHPLGSYPLGCLSGRDAMARQALMTFDARFPSEPQ